MAYDDPLDLERRVPLFDVEKEYFYMKVPNANFSLGVVLEKARKFLELPSQNLDSILELQVEKFLSSDSIQILLNLVTLCDFRRMKTSSRNGLTATMTASYWIIRLEFECQCITKEVTKSSCKSLKTNL